MRIVLFTGRGGVGKTPPAAPAAVPTAPGGVPARWVWVPSTPGPGQLFPPLAPHLLPVRGHIIVTAPVAARLRPWSANAGFEYGQQLPDGRLLIDSYHCSRDNQKTGRLTAALFAAVFALALQMSSVNRP